MGGKKVYDEKNNSSFSINTLNFDNGVYLIKIINPEGKEIKSEKVAVIK